jgi:hypothetical protein
MVYTKTIRLVPCLQLLVESYAIATMGTPEGEKASLAIEGFYLTSRKQDALSYTPLLIMAVRHDVLLSILNFFLLLGK